MSRKLRTVDYRDGLKERLKDPAFLLALIEEMIKDHVRLETETLAELKKLSEQMEMLSNQMESIRKLVRFTMDELKL